ncbi:hypothetical protein GH714_027582 [Hevea brasiliensis]|uniref:Uncharacterized protein n=1 Tax=Hevea brasiliensis TaxID=3981 RepID=A0A6A6ME41_HEVBR|nr:hypothetical protein GH714_027582 [Hevea brasiliensis]
MLSITRNKQKWSRRATREKREARGHGLVTEDSKKQHLNIDIGNINKELSSYDHEDNSEICESSDNHLALGVFDFPWLKEGTISKSEEWCFEDSFEFSLHDTCTTASLAHEFSGQYLCETPETFVESIDIPLYKFEEIVWSLEMENADCAWGSMLNQPLTQDGA